MKKDKKISTEAAELRRRAEKQLRGGKTEGARPQAEDETQRLLHELQVHQIELEMQNEELRRARAELEAALEKYTDLYDFAPVGYVTLGPDDEIRRANLTAARLFGVERSRLVGGRFGFLVCEPDRPAFKAFLKKLFQSRARESCEVALLQAGNHSPSSRLSGDRDDGKASPLSVRIEAVVSEDGQECRAVVMDLTERKRVEDAHLILSKLESTGILAGGIAHDFNNLLAVMLGNLELARMVAQPRGGLAMHLEEAQKAVWTARDLTQQLITFAKGGTPVREVISLSGVIREAVTFSLRGSPVKCEFFISPDLWRMEADKSQIGQVIWNLTLNAREAMPEGGTMSVRAENVELGSEMGLPLPPGEYVKLTIADQGVGIPERILPRIFDPYFSTKERGNQRGMGLGLTICHSILQNHGGAITVVSKEGVGTTFQIYLPASHEMMQEERPAATAPEVLPRTGKVLVMDDEKMLRNFLGEALQMLGHEVELTENGEKAVELYQAAKELGRPFDGVILDLTIRGGMGGVQTIKALQKIDPLVKAVVSSGYADDPVMVDYERYGFRGALAKPYGIASLRQTLARVMGS
jgi:two-component system, cell cycle sensor histidine kinase and response regulator CckA